MNQNPPYSALESPQVQDEVRTPPDNNSHLTGVAVPAVDKLPQAGGPLKRLSNNSGGQQELSKAFVVSLTSKRLRISRY
jgi:hypothetical protein